MREKRLFKKVQFYMGLLCLGIFLAGCGRNETSTQEGATEVVGLPETGIEENSNLTSQAYDDRTLVGNMDLYLISAWIGEEHKVRLYRYATGMEYEYRYGDSTLFRDKYGDYANRNELMPGTIVCIGSTDSQGCLTKIQEASDIWSYDEVKSFSIDQDRIIFQTTEGRYLWEEDLYVFSNENRVSIGEIQSEDVLSINGYGKTILSIQITQSHGTLALSNTELFEGSLIQIGSKIFREITEDMELSIPEGTYLLSVANNGWGGSTEITIQRGEITQLDLDTIKGDGPKHGKIHFVIDFPNAELYIDGEQVDHHMLQRIVYGKHKITVKAEGYEDWSRYLYVNSEEATIEIELVDEEAAASESVSDTQSEETKEDDEEDESQSESQKREEEKQEALEEYYTTLTDMIESMT